jgi:hypothetical protein
MGAGLAHRIPGLTTQWSGRPTAQALWLCLSLVLVGRRSPAALGVRMMSAPLV